LIRSASQGEPTGNVIRPIFQGFGFPLKASHGVDLISYGYGPYRAWMFFGSFAKTPSGSLAL
jgi:hypothetical protein